MSEVQQGYGPYPDQERWFDLKEKLGGDQEARKFLAARLREAATIVEKGGWIDVFGCDVPDHDKPICKTEHFIETISVTLSTPWPG